MLDARLIFITVVSALISMLTTLNVAARPAAVKSGQVATAFTISQLFFMLTRFSNLFYMPLLAVYIRHATDGGHLDLLYQQFQIVILGAAVGGGVSWLLLPTFIELYQRGIRSMQHRQSMLRVLLRLLSPQGWRTVLGSLRPASNLGIKLFHLQGVPAGFLLINVAATAIWTVGGLCSLYVTALEPNSQATAILLSGLVNSAAAICFSFMVDPKAALITDRAILPIRDLGRRLNQGSMRLLAGDPIAGLAFCLPKHSLALLQPQRQDLAERRVRITAVHLAMGNCLGGLLGLLVFAPGIQVIQRATQHLAQHGQSLVQALWAVVALNALVALLASTVISSRVSAVLTGRVATALSIYNFVFLITRLAQQIYAPVIGAIKDSVSSGTIGNQGLPQLEYWFRQILAGAAVGALLACLLMPTCIEVYRRAILALDRRGSLPALVFALLFPPNWLRLATCLRPPGLLGLSRAAVKALPKSFLLGNVLVTSIQTVGVLAAIYAGALDRAYVAIATTLSSVVNGVATITLSLIVDPTVALITDQTIKGERPLSQMHSMAVLLMAGTFLGTLLSQFVFMPAAQLILWVAHQLA